MSNLSFTTIGSHRPILKLKVSSNHSLINQDKYFRFVTQVILCKLIDISSICGQILFSMIWRLVLCVLDFFEGLRAFFDLFSYIDLKRCVSNSIAIRTRWTNLEPKVGQIRFYIPEDLYWDIVFKFFAVLAKNAFSHMDLGFTKFPKLLLDQF